MSTGTVIQTGGVLFHGDSVTDTSATALYPLGLIREEDGKKFRYVQYESGSAITCIADGICGLLKDQGGWVVTQDISETGVNLVAGATMSVIPKGGFGWIQTQGGKELLTATVGAVGDALVYANTDGGAPAVSGGGAGTSAGVFGFAYKAHGGAATYTWLSLP